RGRRGGGGAAGARAPPASAGPTRAGRGRARTPSRPARARGRRRQGSRGAPREEGGGKGGDDEDGGVERVLYTPPPSTQSPRSRRPCGPLPQGAVGAGPPVGVARLLGDGDGLEAGDEPDEHGRDLGPAAVEGERFEVGGGRVGPAPVGPELLGLLPVV